MLQALITMEQNLLLWIQDNVRNDVLTPIVVLITTLGNGGAVWLMIAAGLLIPKKTRKVGILALIALLFSWLIDNVMLKNLVARTRPYEVVPGLVSLVGAQKDYSFPSGHTGSSFAAAVVLLKGLPRKYGLAAITLAVLIGLSRLYVGVHYPSDVLCGAMIGTEIALITVWLGSVLPVSWEWKRHHSCVQK